MTNWADEKGNWYQIAIMSAVTIEPPEPRNKKSWWIAAAAGQSTLASMQNLDTDQDGKVTEKDIIARYEGNTEEEREAVFRANIEWLEQQDLTRYNITRGNVYLNTLQFYDISQRRKPYIKQTENKDMYAALHYIDKLMWNQETKIQEIVEPLIKKAENIEELPEAIEMVQGPAWDYLNNTLHEIEQTYKRL